MSLRDPFNGGTSPRTKVRTASEDACLVPIGSPRPMRPHVTTADGRSPGSRLSALRRLPSFRQWLRWRSARRLQLRGQPRHWAQSPHRVPFQSPEGNHRDHDMRQDHARQLRAAAGTILSALTATPGRKGSRSADQTVLSSTSTSRINSAWRSGLKRIRPSRIAWRSAARCA